MRLSTAASTWLCVIGICLGAGASRSQTQDYPEAAKASDQPPLAAPKMVQADVSGFIEDPGREITAVHCTACHNSRVVTQNRMSRQRWDQTIDWLQNTQNLWPIEPEQRAEILDYLAEFYGVDEQGQGSPEPVYRPNPIW